VATTTPETPAANPRRSWSKLFLILAAITCYVGFWWISAPLGITGLRGFDGSVLSGPGAFLRILITGVLILAAVKVGTVIAGRIRPDAGLFAAAFGLLALTNRGRPTYAVLHEAGGARGVYLLLALELLVLYALLAAGWWILRVLERRGHIHRDAARDGLADIEIPPGAGWSALATHALIMAAVMVILGQSEDKKQVLAAVGLGAFAGAFFPYWQPGVRPAAWYWAGPLIVGLAGYVWAYVAAGQGGLEIGRPGVEGGFLAALARPLPLDYASLGTAGAIVGYWMRRKSLRDREIAEASGAA
jgi:hypothetical protein